MSFSYQERASDSPLVKNIWQTSSNASGIFIAPADGCWDIMVTKYNGTVYVTINGQASSAATVPYGAGAETLGISFVPGAFLTHLPGERLADTAIGLPATGSFGFWLDSRVLEIPTFENADVFVDRLTKANVLAQNEVVNGFLNGQPKVMSERTRQRHFLRTTGLTPYYFSQLQRAQAAVRLLQQGKRPVDVALETGYSDQPHMAKAIRHIMGQTPTEIIRRHV